LLGSDPAGNLLGTKGAVPALVAGGNAGTLGKVIPAGNPPLAAAGSLVNNTLGVLAGTTPSPVGNVLNGGGISLTGTPGNSGNANIFSNVINTASNIPLAGSVAGGTHGGTPATGNVLGNVTNTVTGIVTGGTASNPVSSLLNGLTRR
jgi:hypothetical protein